MTTDIQTISTAELKEMIDGKRDISLVETLPEEEFKKGHLPGAINIPTAEVEQEAPRQLDKSKPIVVYCANKACPASPNAAEKLREMGYEHVLDFEEGKEGWRQAGHELVR